MPQWFACGHGHKIAAELTWAKDSPQNLAGYWCPVCTGECSNPNIIDLRILAPMQPVAPNPNRHPRCEREPCEHPNCFCLFTD